MRVLFSCTAGDGHLRPLLPLARAFADAGHVVTFATAAANHDVIRGVGLTNLPAGPSIADVEHLTAPFRAQLPQIPPDERRARSFTFRFATVDAPRKLDELYRCATEWRPDLIVHDSSDLAAPPVAAALGIPSVHHSFGQIIPFAALELAKPRTDELWRRLGVEPEPHAGLYRGSYVDICPPSLQAASPPDGTPWLRLRPAEPGVGDDSWRERLGDGAVVYVTLGTVFNAVELFRVVLGSLGDVDATVLVTIGRDNDPDELGPLPRNVIVERFVPQADVLPFVDVGVGHGGSGSTLAALAHAVPLLLLPRGADQFDNAAACAAAGVARVLPPDAVTAEAVASAVDLLLDDEGAQRAARGIADEIRRMSSPAEVVAALV